MARSAPSLALLVLLGCLATSSLEAKQKAKRHVTPAIGECGASAAMWRHRLLEAFERWDEQMGGLGYTQYDNTKGLLANNEPQVLEAYLLMYEATRDSKYLLKAAVHGESILRHRDDFAKRVDYSERANPAWSNRNPRYVRNDRPFPFSAESAWLSYPLAYFAFVVRREASVGDIQTLQGRTLRETADWFVREIEKTIEHHAKDWHTDRTPRGPIGFYTTAADFSDAVGLQPSAIEPMNFQTSMGRLFAMMYLATEYEPYLAQARRLANFFLFDVSYNKDRDSYHWYYWPRVLYYKAWRQPHANIEDISHGGLSIDFMRLMHEHRLGVVGSTDMRRFANTFLRSVYRGRPGRFAQTVSGLGAAGARVRHLGYYGALAATNGAVADIMRDNLEQLGLERSSGSALMFVAVATQLRYPMNTRSAFKPNEKFHQLCSS